MVAAAPAALVNSRADAPTQPPVLRVRCEGRFKRGSIHGCGKTVFEGEFIDGERAE